MSTAYLHRWVISNQQVELWQNQNSLYCHVTNSDCKTRNDQLDAPLDIEIDQQIGFLKKCIPLPSSDCCEFSEPSFKLPLKSTESSDHREISLLRMENGEVYWQIFLRATKTSVLFSFSETKTKELPVSDKELRAQIENHIHQFTGFNHLPELQSIGLLVHPVLQCQNAELLSLRMSVSQGKIKANDIWSRIENILPYERYNAEARKNLESLKFAIRNDSALSKEAFAKKYFSVLLHDFRYTFETKTGKPRDYQVFLEPTKIEQSTIDPTYILSEGCWAVGLICVKGCFDIRDDAMNHAQIFIEGIEKGKHFLLVSHLVRDPDKIYPSVVKIHDFSKRPTSLTYHSRTELFLVQSTKGREMLNSIILESCRKIIPPEIDVRGSDAWGIKNGDESCFTWGRGHLRTIGIDLGTSWICGIATITSMFTRSDASQNMRRIFELFFGYRLRNLVESIEFKKI